jgi:hypothetical protein
MKLVALAVIALAGTVAADYTECTETCMNTYIEKVNADPWNSGDYATEYQDCVFSCYGFNAVASMAKCGTCINNYETCLDNNPYDWSSCLNPY